MKQLQYKLMVLIACICFVPNYAQKLEKKYTEKFSVNKNVVIDINTRYTDIEIETWDKNEVLIEAFIDVKDEADRKVIDDYLKKWNFEALGNKSSIKINSKSSGLIDIYTFDFDAPDYDVLFTSDIQNTIENLQFVLPEMPEIPEIPELPEILFEMPELPEIPELPELPSQFDFKEYKKDKSYLERWKKDNKDIIGKNAKVKIGRNSISITSDDDFSYKWNITTEGQNELAEEIQERLEETKIQREEYKKRLEIRMKERQKEMKERQKELKERQKELQGRIKERNEERKLALIKRQEAHEKRAKEMAKHRTEVRDILAKREKVKIKRIIKIKAPKNAKFNMNVRYGSMSFPK